LRIKNKIEFSFLLVTSKFKSMIQNIFSEELIQAVGWTMIHSLWQGFAVAILMGIAMIGLQKKIIESAT